MSIEDYSAKIKSEAFIKSYLASVGNASEDELKQFCKIIAEGGDYMVLGSGSHLMDCWQLWQSAREPLIKDLKTAISEHMDFSSNSFVWTPEHDFNRYDKLAELGQATPEWIVAMDFKSVIEQLLINDIEEIIINDDRNSFDIRERAESISIGSYGDENMELVKKELIAALIKLADVSGDDLVIDSPAGAFTIRDKLTELGFDGIDSRMAM